MTESITRSTSHHDQTPVPPRAAGAGTSTMTRLAAFAQRHHWAALGAWVVLLALVTLTAQMVGDAYGNGSDVSLPGTQSEAVSRVLERHAPDRVGDSVTVVVHDERGWDSHFDAARLVAAVRAIPAVKDVRPPDVRQGTVSPDGTLGLFEVSLPGEQGSATPDTYRRIRDTAMSQSSGQAQVDVAGKGIRKLERRKGSAEGVGLLAALVILVLMFGSLLAASIPLITALLAVATTLGAVTLLAHLISIPDFTPPLLVLVGLGVGIDYALLVFSRYREEIRLGRSNAEATRTALETAGRAVLFAGASVIIALLGMFTLRIPAFEGTVTAVALTVLVTMIASLTLLPALLSLFGPRIARRVRRRAHVHDGLPGARWRRWARLVQRAPWVTVLAAAAALVALAIPALSLHLGFNDASNDPRGTTTRQAYELISHEFGPGANGPLLIVTHGSTSEAQSVLLRVRDTPGVDPDRVSGPIALGDRWSMIRADATSGPQDQSTADTVKTLRTRLGSGALVGGATAATIDYSSAVGSRLPLFIGAVVGVSALLLMSVFGSLVIAAKAAALNLLSIGAALGAMKLVYQDGLLWGSPGPIEAFMPVFIFAIVFGLSMDYEVFLISRMRDEWRRTGDARRAVEEGLAHTGGVITAAAAIMFAVFGAFAMLPDRMLQQAGFAMAVAVAIDAVVVRCLLVPALMGLLGKRAWWVPPVMARGRQSS